VGQTLEHVAQECESVDAVAVTSGRDGEECRCSLRAVGASGEQPIFSADGDVRGLPSRLTRMGSSFLSDAIRVFIWSTALSAVTAMSEPPCSLTKLITLEI
jgi:hypothetical protein